MAMIHTAAMIIGFDGYSSGSRHVEQDNTATTFSRWQFTIKQRNAILAPVVTFVATVTVSPVIDAGSSRHLHVSN